MVIYTYLELPIPLKVVELNYSFSGKVFVCRRLSTNKKRFLCALCASAVNKSYSAIICVNLRLNFPILSIFALCCSLPGAYCLTSPALPRSPQRNCTMLRTATAAVSVLSTLLPNWTVWNP